MEERKCTFGKDAQALSVRQVPIDLAVHLLLVDMGQNLVGLVSRLKRERREKCQSMSLWVDLGHDTHLSNELANLVRRRLLRRRVLDAQLRLQPVRAKPPPRSLAPASVARKEPQVEDSLDLRVAPNLFDESRRVPDRLAKLDRRQGRELLLELGADSSDDRGVVRIDGDLSGACEGQVGCSTDTDWRLEASDGGRGQSPRSSHTPLTGARSKDVLDSKAVAAAPTNFRVRLCD